MILPDTFFDFLPWIWAGLAVWLALWWRWLSKTTRLQKGLFSAGIIVSLAMFRFGPSHPHVVIVRFSKLGTPVEKQRGQLLFPKRYTFQNGKTTWLWSLPDKYFGTIVVNDSPETLRIEYVSYANNPMLGLGPTPPTPVPPMSTFPWTSSIDNVGPDDTPPDSTETVAGLGMAVRTWLTWGNDSDGE